MLVNIAGDCIVGPNYVRQLGVDEVVERVNVLLDQSFDSKKRRQQVPFILGSVDWVCQFLAVVEWLEQGVKSVVRPSRWPLRLLLRCTILYRRINGSE